MEPAITPKIRCFCGRKPHRINTLQYDLTWLIHRHTLPEIFDRLADLINEHGDRQDPSIKDQWNDLTKLMEQATERALTIATLYDEEGKELWE